MESRIANLMQYGIGPSLNQGVAVGGVPRAFPASSEEIAKWQVEEKKREAEYRNRQVASCIVAIAECLVTEHALEVPEAFETAKTLWEASNEFVKNFKLPEDA